MKFNKALTFGVGLMLAGSMSVNAQKVTFNGEQVSLKQAFQKIESVSNYKIAYNSTQLDVNKIVTLNQKNTDVLKVLDTILTGTGCTYKIDKGYIVITPKQKNPIKKIEGVVKDAKGEPVIGATVMVKGSTTGTITDFDGKFSLDAEDGSNIEISYIGYKSQLMTADSGKLLAVTLKEDTEVLDEVVVTALGIKREEKALGYSVQKIEGEKLSRVKSVDFATNLTGKVAGLNVSNSTEFNEAPSLLLRGESPLVVIDGVPYNNISFRDIAADDIESVDVLKGATASALYGARGGSGAIMITTKRGEKEGLDIEVNSSTMFNAGYLRKPEVQTSYSSGTGGKYRTGDYVWGDKMDIGHEAEQWNPYTHEWELCPLVSKGKNNLKNFQELSFVTNNNVSLTQKGKLGSFRTSLTHVYNKGQWPNEKLNKLTYTVSGKIKYKKISVDAGITYNKRFYPNKGGTGYGGSGYLYNLLVWSGTEFDIRDYKDYWLKKNELSNWMDRNYYENPYLIANEVTSSGDYNVINAFVNGAYEIKPWLKAILRSGADLSTNKAEWKTPIGSSAGWGSKKGYYGVGRYQRFSINNDILFIAEHKIGNFSFEHFFGGTIYYMNNDDVMGETKGGLVMPGFYSLNASVDPAGVSKSYQSKQVNSLYGKISSSWNSSLFLDITGRNDWSSTLPNETRSYFYPSVAVSAVMSEFIKLPDFFSFWKLRGAWTVTKQDMGIFAINNVYNIVTDVWNNMTAAYSSSQLKDAIISPASSRTYELGTVLHFFKNRLRFDLTYYNKLNYNNSSFARVSYASGFGSSLINIEEEQVRKGWEITVKGDIIKTKDINWSAIFNWTRDRYYYGKVDPIYSTQKPWVKKGARWDWLSAIDYQRDPDGNVIHGNDGLPLMNPTATLQGYTSPDWTWGLSTSFSYKNFSVDISFDGRVGGLSHSMIDQAMWNSGVHIKSDNKFRYDEVVNGKKTYIGKGVKVLSGSADWDSDGNIIRDDRIFASNDKPVSYEVYTIRMNPWAGEVRTQNIFNSSFIKLRNLAINYTLTPNLCNKLHLKGASVGFVGQNLWMWTKDFKYSDPDIGKENMNSPSIRYVGFNVKINL